MRSKKYIIYLLVTILTLSIGLTYAYFKGRVTGDGKDISLKSKGIYVLYSGDATLASESISPGWSITKEFTIENQGSDNETYDIYIEDLINTFVTTGYLQYKITSASGYNMTEYKDIPKSETSTDTVLAYSVPIKPNEKQTYKMDLIYKDTNEDQSADIGKTLSGVLGIKIGTKDPNLFTASIEVINGTSDVTSKQVYRGKNVSFTITAKEEYTTERYTSTCNNISMSNGILTISNVQSNLNCTITLKLNKLTLAEAMLRDNPTISERTDFSVENTSNTTGTLYKTNKTEDGSDVYYYSGITQNNWIKFGKFSYNYYLHENSTTGETSGSTDCCGTILANAGNDMYWRIIRTNEDGSVRLLYSGTDINSNINNLGDIKWGGNKTNSEYLGYIYSRLKENDTNSSIKNYIDKFYENNLLTNYDKYISKSAIYCNDRAYTLDSDNSKYYASPFRINKFKPSYKCGDNGDGELYSSTRGNNDKFSVNTESGGNGLLKYPAALMTADEIIFAGINGTSGHIRNLYFNINGSGTEYGGGVIWWLLSPNEDSNLSKMYIINGGKLYQWRIDVSAAVRPVISIDKCAYVASGNGTPDNPYTIDETSCS